MAREELTRCPRCGGMFHCSRSGKCWCHEVALPLDALDYIEDHYEGCLCPACLNEIARSLKSPDGKFTLTRFIYTRKGNQS